MRQKIFSTVVNLIGKKVIRVKPVRNGDRWKENIVKEYYK